MRRPFIQIPKTLLGKKLDGEWVFLNLKNGVYYGLNETGSAIWDEISRSKDSKQILERLELTFGMDRSLLEKDLNQFLRELLREGLIRFEAAIS